MEALKKAEKAKNRASEATGPDAVSPSSPLSETEPTLAAVAGEATQALQPVATAASAPLPAEKEGSPTISGPADEPLSTVTAELDIDPSPNPSTGATDNEAADDELTDELTLVEMGDPDDVVEFEVVSNDATTVQESPVQEDISSESVDIPAGECDTVATDAAIETPVETTSVERSPVAEVSASGPLSSKTTAELLPEPPSLVKADITTENRSAEAPTSNKVAESIAEPPQPTAASRFTTPPIVGVGANKKGVGRRHFWSGLALSFLLILGAMFYYFNTMLEETDQTVAALPVEEVEATISPVVTLSAKGAEGSAVNKPENVLITPPVAVAQKPVATPKVTPPVRQGATTQAKAKSAPSLPVREVERKPSLRSVEKPAREIAITRRERRDPLEVIIQQAYQAYQSDEYLSAERNYQRALEIDGDNRDARLGLAVIAQRSGRLERARTLYQSLLVLNPKDSIALTGLISLQGNHASGENESRIKLLLAEEPTAAHLHFALGIEYVSQSRWPDAQQAFFEAYRYAPDNADYSFNLAVSLEQLGQPQAALDYYRRASEAAVGQTVGFEREQLNQRIASLSVEETAR